MTNVNLRRQGENIHLTFQDPGRPSHTVHLTLPDSFRMALALLKMTLRAVAHIEPRGSPLSESAVEIQNPKIVVGSTADGRVAVSVQPGTLPSFLFDMDDEGALQLAQTFVEILKTPVEFRHPGPSGRN